MNVTTREYFSDTGQTDDNISDAVAPGNRIVVTMLQVYCDTDDINVRIGFGATAVPSKPADGATVDGVLFSADTLKAGSGAVLGNGSGIIGIGGDGEELRITTSAGDINVIVTYFTYAA